MNAPITFAIAGFGDRGSTYASMQQLFPDQMKAPSPWTWGLPDLWGVRQRFRRQPVWRRPFGGLPYPYR